VSVEGPRHEAEPAHSTPAFVNGVEPLRVASPAVTSVQQTGLGVRQVILLVVTMVFIAVAVSAAVTLYVTRGSRSPASETTQP